MKGHKWEKLRRLSLLLFVSVGIICLCTLWLLPSSLVNSNVKVTPVVYDTVKAVPKPPGFSSNSKRLVEFQSKLETTLPLDCHPGPEGVLAQKHYGRFLRTLLDYADYHNHTRSSRTLTWQCTVHDHCRGLGDRIRGIVTTFLLAIFSRRRFMMIWEDKSGKYLHPHMIDWSYDHTLRRKKKGTSNCNRSDPCFFVIEKNITAIPTVIASNVSDVVLITNLPPATLKSSLSQEWIKTGLRSSGLGELSWVEMRDILGVVFRYLFTIDRQLQKKMQLAMDTLGLKSSPYIALHLRTGFAGMPDEEVTKKAEKNVSKWQAALDCAVGIADRHLGNGSVVFLATDSNLVKEKAISEQVHTLRWPLIHVDRRPDREGVLTGWVEMLLLAQADVLVSSWRSGFSWTAGLLCGLHRHENTTVSTDHCK